jgi:hypothetical protein
VLDEVTISRIKNCKRHAFPICLEESLAEILKGPSGEVLLERIVIKLGVGERKITSAEQIWVIYGQVLDELATLLGKDVSEVLRFQSVKKMEMMQGCMYCPLYQREISKRQDQ